MALSDHKITDAAIAEKGVVAAPDQLSGSARTNKMLFDRLIREAVKEDYNGLIDALMAATGAGEIGAAVDGLSGATIQNVLNSVKTALDSKISSVELDEATGTFTFTRENGTKIVIDTALEKNGTRGRGWYQHNVGMGESQGWMWASKADAPEWGEGDWLYNSTNGYVGLCTIRTDNADGSGSANITYKGTLKGTDGTTPHIGANGNWFLGETDTGVKAAAEAATHETAGIVKPSADFDITEDGTLSLYKAMEILSIKMNDIKPTGSYPMYILYEKGTKLTGFVVAWELNKVPMRQTFQANVSGGVDLDEMDIGTTARSTSDLSGEQLVKWAAFANKEYTILSAYASLQFVLKATDARGKSATKLLRIHAYNGVYTGVAPSPDVIDAAFLNTLKKSVADRYARTFTVDAKAGQYIWYACPTKLEAIIESDVTPAFNVGGFDGGFSKVATLDYTNAVGYTEEYQVWRSDNAGLGSTTVKVS